MRIRVGNLFNVLQGRVAERVLRGLLPTLAILVAAGSAGAQQTAVRGRVTATWGDPQEGRPELVLHLVDAQGRSSRLELPSHLRANVGSLLRLDRALVDVQGELTQTQTGGRRLLINALSTVSLDSESLVQADARGNGPWAVLLCRFPDVASTPHPTSWYEDLFGSTAPGLADFWNEVSFQWHDASGSRVLGWMDLPLPRDSYFNGSSPGLRALFDACTELADPLIDFSAFAGVHMAFNSDLGGYAWGGSMWMERDGLAEFYPTTWMPTWADHDTYAHEMGHGIGMPHSSGPYGQTYDSRWDVMSGGYSLSSGTFRRLAIHTISFHKDRVGWIPSQVKFQPDPDSRSIVRLAHLASDPGSGEHAMIQIPLPDGEFYTVEARRDFGYDGPPAKAVVLHHIDPDRTDGSAAQVVDPDNDGNPNDDGAAWVPGETFTDAPNGVRVSVLSETANGFEVEIEVGSPSSDPNPLIVLTPTSLAYETTEGTDPAAKSFTVKNDGGGTLEYTVSSNRNWLGLSLTSGNLAAGASQSVSVSVDASGLSVGTQNGAITVGGNGENAPQTISVTVVVNEQPAAPLIALTPTSLAYETTEGTDPASKGFTVKNDGGGTLEYTVSTNRNWLGLSRTSGSLAAGASQSVSVSVDASGLSVGTQSGTITVGGNGTNAPQTISVTVVVNEQPAAPLIALTPTSLAYETSEGTNPAAKSFTVKNDGGGTLEYTVSTNRNWLGLSRTSGSLAAGASQSVSVSVDASGLSVGTQSGTITVGGNADNAPQTVAISVTVSEAPSEPLIAVGPTSLDFQIKGNKAPGPKKLGLQNAGSQELNWNASTSQGWLRLNKTSGTLVGGGDDSLTVEVSIQGLEAGTYDATIDVTGNADNSPQSVAVRLKMTKGGVVKLKKGRLTFAGSTEQQPRREYVQLENDGDASAEWTATAEADWLELATASGVIEPGASAALALQVDVTGLSPGIHSASIEFAGGDDELPDTLQVELMVTNGPGVRHLPEQAAAHLLGAGTALGSDELDYIDFVGNGNGRFDVGDLRAWLIQAGELPADAPLLNLRPGYASQPDSTTEGLPAVSRESAERRD